MTMTVRNSTSRTPSRRTMRTSRARVSAAAVFNSERTCRRDTRANAAAEKAPKKAAEAPKVFEPPPLDPSTPSPIFGGGTGGLLRKAQVEEFYVITWDATKEQIFEMPTGGSAIMNKGGNLLKQVREYLSLSLSLSLFLFFNSV